MKEWISEEEIELTKAMLLTAQFDDTFVRLRPSHQAQGALIVGMHVSGKDQMIQQFFDMIGENVQKRMTLANCLINYLRSFTFNNVGKFIQYYYGVIPTHDKRILELKKEIKRPNQSKRQMMKAMFEYGKQVTQQRKEQRVLKQQQMIQQQQNTHYSQDIEANKENVLTEKKEKQVVTGNFQCDIQDSQPLNCTNFY